VEAMRITWRLAVRLAVACKPGVRFTAALGRRLVARAAVAFLALVLALRLCIRAAVFAVRLTGQGIRAAFRILGDVAVAVLRPPLRFAARLLDAFAGLLAGALRLAARGLRAVVGVVGDALLAAGRGLVRVASAISAAARIAGGAVRRVLSAAWGLVLGPALAKARRAVIVAAAVAVIVPYRAARAVVALVAEILRRPPPAPIRALIAAIREAGGGLRRSIADARDGIRAAISDARDSILRMLGRTPAHGRADHAHQIRPAHRGWHLPTRHR